MATWNQARLPAYAVIHRQKSMSIYCLQVNMTTINVCKKIWQHGTRPRYQPTYAVIHGQTAMSIYCLQINMTTINKFAFQNNLALLNNNMYYV